jgi:hypothetical protein
MRKVTLLFFAFLLVYSFANAQGYLQNDDDATHTDGITINEISAYSYGDGVGSPDFNADGEVRAGDDDEFIEIVNSSPSSININGWTLGDNSTSVFTFPDISIPSDNAVVIFTRGATVTNFNPGPGNIVLSCSFALNVSAGDAIGLRNTNGLYIEVNWEGGSLNTAFLTGDPTLVEPSVTLDSWNEHQSQSRNPDYTGSWAQHPTISGTVDWSNSIEPPDGPGQVTLTNPQGSPGRRVGQDIPLPVELISFKAIAGDGKVQLQWETSSESENQGFIILRSDGKSTDFKEIASYESEYDLRGAGSTSEKSSYQYIDKHLFNGIRYYYKLIDVSMNGVQTEQGTVSAIPHPESMNVMVSYPKSFSLNQNYPNPFNPSTKIGFSIPKTDQDILDVNVSVYNQLGQKVKTLYNGPISPGKYELEWNGLDENNQSIPSGIYLYHLKSSHFTSSKKMIYMK